MCMYVCVCVWVCGWVGVVRIYTMCIPGHETSSSLQSALPDLEIARNQARL